MRITIAILGASASVLAAAASAEVAPSISRTVELRQAIDMDCVASATLGVPGVSSVTRPAPSEAYVASPNEIKTDKFVYTAPGFGGTLSFAPGFLGNSIYYRQTVDFPDGKPTPDKVAAVRSFMIMVDQTISRRCKIVGLNAADEACAAISCPTAH